MRGFSALAIAGLLISVSGCAATQQCMLKKMRAIKGGGCVHPSAQCEGDVPPPPALPVSPTTVVKAMPVQPAPNSAAAPVHENPPTAYPSPMTDPAPPPINAQPFGPETTPPAPGSPAQSSGSGAAPASPAVKPTKPGLPAPSLPQGSLGPLPGVELPFSPALALSESRPVSVPAVSDAATVPAGRAVYYSTPPPARAVSTSAGNDGPVQYLPMPNESNGPRNLWKERTPDPLGVRTSTQPSAGTTLRAGLTTRPSVGDESVAALPLSLPVPTANQRHGFGVNLGARGLSLLPRRNVDPAFLTASTEVGDASQRLASPVALTEPLDVPPTAAAARSRSEELDRRLSQDPVLSGRARLDSVEGQVVANKGGVRPAPTMKTDSKTVQPTSWSESGASSRKGPIRRFANRLKAAAHGFMAPDSVRSETNDLP